MKKEKYGMFLDDSKMGIQPEMTPKEKAEWDKDCKRMAEKLLKVLPPNDYEKREALA